jgi:hypothetical protein
MDVQRRRAPSSHPSIMEPMRALFSFAAFAVFGGASWGTVWGQSLEPAPAGPYSGLSPSSQLLARTRAHMAEILLHQPNYTCLETIQRSFRTGAARKLQPQDTLRLEVALVDGAEMFAWPGSKKFEETDLRKMIPTGTFGNGNFALHARAVFMGGVATFVYRGEEMLETRPPSSGALVRYDFHVPRALSGYTLRVEDRSGVAGFHGSFWAEKDSLDVRRLEVIAEEIPADLGVTAAADRVDYARQRIGNADFLLPVESELSMADTANIESHNHVSFTGCRQYTGESVLTFDDVDANPSPDRAAAPRDADLPPGLSLDVILLDDLDPDAVAIGDPVRGQLDRDLKRKGEVFAPKGSAVQGRVTRVERRADFTALGITLVSIQTPAVTFHLHASLDSVAGLQLLAPPSRLAVRPAPAQPGEGLIVVRAGHVRLNRGILMYWRT